MSAATEYLGRLIVNTGQLTNLNVAFEDRTRARERAPA